MGRGGAWTRSVAVLALTVAVVGCVKPEPPLPPPPAPEIRLDDSVAQAAAVYMVFMREAETFDGGFADAAAIQAAIGRGAAYQPDQLARGLVAYGAVLAMQSPAFVAGVRAYASDSMQRREILDRLRADPAYAATFPGAEAAAGLIAEVTEASAAAVEAAAERVEADAYAIQSAGDPRRRWAGQPAPDKDGRLERAKTVSNQSLPAPEVESVALSTAVHGVPGRVAAASLSAPYTPAITRSLAVAARALLGDSPNESEAETVLQDPSATFCLQMSKLNLFQCLAASKPNYEDMFCLGRHVVRDLADCTRQTTRASISPSVD